MPTARFTTLALEPSRVSDAAQALTSRLSTLPARIPPGTAYLAQAGAVGTVGFEVPLTVDVVPEKLTRSSWVMGYCVPALAVTNPAAVKKLTGLEG